MSERLRAREQVQVERAWRKHVAHCMFCSTSSKDPDTADEKKLCELGRALRKKWKEPK